MQYSNYIHTWYSTATTTTGSNRSCYSSSSGTGITVVLLLHGSTPTDRRTFGVDRLVWTEAARKGEGVPWYTGVLLGAERFMTSWHKSEEEAIIKLREVNRAA